MYAAYAYLVLTLAVLWGSYRRSPASRDGALILAFWFVARNLVYVRGEVEGLQTVLAACVFLLLCSWHIRRHGHWLGYGLFAAGLVALLWSAGYDRYGGGNAYLFKWALNGVFVGMAGMVVLSWRV